MINKGKGIRLKLKELYCVSSNNETLFFFIYQKENMFYKKIP